MVAPDCGFDSCIVVRCEGGRRGALTAGTFPQRLQVCGAWLPTNSCIIPHNRQQCTRILSHCLQVPTDCKQTPSSPFTLVTDSMHGPIPEPSIASSRWGLGAVQDSAVPAYCTRAVQQDGRTCWLQSVVSQRRVRILGLQILRRNIS